jgi:hypothetical protein
VPREYSVYWAVTVKSPGGDGVEPYERRFEFRGETAEQDAQDCRRKAKAAGLDARIVKAKAVNSSWTPELAE